MDVEAMFEAALDRPTTAERRAYLDEACAGDAQLRLRVERLLAADAERPGILDHGQEAVLLMGAYRPQANLEAGQHFAGRFRLLRKLGEGGMGEVWVADQTEPVQRRVAVKVIRLGSARLAARFEAERQALALMDHPNIGKVFDAGAAGDRPFLVMELIDGVPITRYCDQAGLSLRQRLELFASVCGAVQHAHLKGVIHRDIKPSNVLVAMYDGEPVAKVIDFGIAKTTGPRLGAPAASTEVGTVVGTLEYMSPEQAEAGGLDIDTRGDVYSLGVLLYELLTGGVPFPREYLQSLPLSEMLRQIREAEPPAPSARLEDSRAAQVKGELDWVVMRALEKDRARRYQTAIALAADVQRYLADEVVEARPPSAAYRLRKFARRHTGPVLAACLVAVALVGGIAGTTLGLVEARRQRDAAEAREAETQAVLRFVETRIIAAARPEGQAGGLGREVTLRSALEAALPFVDQSFADQPLIEAKLRLTLAVSFGNLGESRVAAQQAEIAYAIYRAHLAPDHLDTLTCMNALGMCYNALGRDADALKLREQTLRLMRAKLGPDDAKTLTAMNNLALSYGSLGRNAEALKLHEEALSRRTAKLGPDHLDTLTSMNNLALTYSNLDRHADALKLGEETLALAMAKLGPGNRMTLNSMDTLAYLNDVVGRHSDAIKLYEQALSLMKDKLGPDHPVTLSTMHSLANTNATLGRHREELDLRERTLALREAKLGPDHPDTVATRNALARLLATSTDPAVRDTARAAELTNKAASAARQRRNK